LIVEDESLIRWALAETLTSRGCAIVEAVDARSAIDVLTIGSQRFDVVVLDYHLPDVHDLTLLATARRLSPESHVIMMTAFMTPEVTARALELGARQVLQKPIELEAVATLALTLATGTPGLGRHASLGESCAATTTMPAA
jgi:DNA-binding NtrC family response regulator